MSAILKRLDRAGLNLRVMLLFGTFAAIVLFVVFPLMTGKDPGHSAGHCDLKEMGSFTFDATTDGPTDIPKWIRELDGKSVMMQGFMVSNSATHLSNFELVYDTGSQRGPRLVQQRVFVRVPKTLTVDYVQDEVRAYGTFHISIDRDPETQKVIRLFKLDLKQLKPV